MSWYLLDTSLIEALLSRFLGSTRYLSIDSLIHQAYFLGVSVYSIAPQYLSRSIETFYLQYLLNTSRSIELLFSVEAWYLLDLLICVFYIYFKVWLSFEPFQIFQSPSLISWPKLLTLSLKALFPLHFRPYPSLNLLVSLLILSFSSSFMHFVT